jgi:hypothetical protein
MTPLACFKCGGTLLATAPLAQLLADERICPRCGALLQGDRRAVERRVYFRRHVKLALPARKDLRVADRRMGQGRRTVAADRYRQNPLVATRTRWRRVQHVLDEDR